MRYPISLNIRDFFYSAGRMYGWDGKTLGVGIDKKLVYQALKEGRLLNITVKGKYKKTFMPEDIIHLGNIHNSYYRVNDKVELIVIPWK